LTIEYLKITVSSSDDGMEKTPNFMDPIRLQGAFFWGRTLVFAWDPGIGVPSISAKRGRAFFICGKRAKKGKQLCMSGYFCW